MSRRLIRRVVKRAGIGDILILALVVQPLPFQPTQIKAPPPPEGIRVGKAAETVDSKNIVDDARQSVAALSKWVSGLLSPSKAAAAPAKPKTDVELIQNRTRLGQGV